MIILYYKIGYRVQPTSRSIELKLENYMASSQISPLNIDNICGLKSVNNSQVYFEPYQKMINVRQNLVEPMPRPGYKMGPNM